jgi:hypothetical protein
MNLSRTNWLYHIGSFLHESSSHIGRHFMFGTSNIHAWHVYSRYVGTQLRWPFYVKTGLSRMDDLLLF